MPHAGEIAGKKHILCVYDNLSTRVLLTAFLNDYQVTIVSNGREARILARRHPFHLYVLDTRLADMSGIELCRCIRTFDANTPIIFFSADADEETRKEALAAGAQAYLVKEIDFLALGQTINQFIFKAELRSLDAKLAEIAAVRDEVQDRLARAEANIDKANKAFFKHRARRAYLAAGGTHANFAALWDQVMRTELSTAQNSQSEF
jgi:DNA-binding response OmpR family regulator